MDLDIMELTAAQRGIFYEGRRYGSVVNNVGMYHNFLVDIDISFFEKARRVVISAADGMRLCLRESAMGSAHMELLSEGEIEPLCHKDFSDKTESKAAACEWMNCSMQTAIVDENLGVFQDYLIKIDENQYWYYMKFNHIFMDGFGYSVFFKKLIETYDALKNNKTCLIDDLGSFVEYAKDSDRYINSVAYEKDKLFWQKKLENYPDHIFKQRYLRKSGIGSKRTHIEIPREKYTPHIARLKELNLGLATYVYAIVTLYLHRTQCINDIPVGTSLHNRRNASEKTIIGSLLNLSVLRVQLEGELTFSNLLSLVDKELRQSFKHSRFPVAELNGLLSSSGEGESGKLYDIIFNYLKLDFSASIGGSSVDSYQLSHGNDNLPLILTLCDYNDEQNPRLILDYNLEYFNDGEAKLILNLFHSLFFGILELLESPISEISLITEEDKHAVGEWNKTDYPYSVAACLYEQFEQVAANTGEITVVSFEGQSLSYSELNARANQLAHYLIEQGVKADTPVGVCLDRSIEMVVGILAIQKAGGAYLPLEPGYPDDRLAYIVQDCAAALVLGQAREAGRAVFSGLSYVSLDTAATVAMLSSYSQENIPRQTLGLGVEHLSYIIYTSGSTGQPKGVMISHRALINRIDWMQRAYQLTPADVVLQKTPYSFDVSVWEFFWPLSQGSRLVMATPGGHRDPQYLQHIIQGEGVTTLHFVPSMLSSYLKAGDWRACTNVRQVFCSGEALSKTLVEEYWSTGTAALLHNLYGPTEAAIDVSYWDCRGYEGRDSIPIGKPISNIQLHVLDTHLQPVPVGVAGQLYIAGDGLARGYINKPELSAEKFIANPMSATPGARMYATGDSARWLSDGELEYLGRIDSQVKLKGFRIELGEIEHVAAAVNGIREAVALVSEDEQLKSYCVVDKAVYPACYQSIKLLSQGKVSEEHLHRLPNGMEVSGLNSSESAFLYKEIFTQQVYEKHGIRLREGACIFDVGANIGMFSIFAATRLNDCRIYAYEPVDSVYAHLHNNGELFGLGRIHSQRMGLSDSEKRVTFNYYPNNSVISGIEGDAEANRALVKHYLQTKQKKEGNGEAISEAELSALLEESLVVEKIEVDLSTVSQQIRAHQIERIDLLKIDVEKSEEAVLQGIAQGDWPKIQQVVVEVHDEGGALARVEGLLSENGFTVVTESNDDQLDGTCLYNVYARREETLVDRAPVQLQHLDWSGRRALIDRIQQQLENRLPDYMVPSALFLLDEFPLTANGKCDRKALLAMTGMERAKAVYVEPRDEVEAALLSIWQDILNISEIGITDNFFRLGGDSIMSIQVVSRAKQAGIHFTVRDLFDYRTIESLMQVVETDSQLDIPQGPVEGEQILLPIQRDFLYGDESENWHFNQAFLLHTPKGFNAGQLPAIVASLYARHDVLRLSFAKTDGVWTGAYQVDASVRIAETIAVEDLSQYRVDEQKAELEGRCQAYQRCLNLREGPLFKAVYFDCGNDEGRLFLVMHHLVVDGVSWRIIFNDLALAYEQVRQGQAINLLPKSSSYQAWGAALNEYRQSEALLAEKAYWQSQLSQCVPAIPLREKNDNELLSELHSATFTLSESDTRKLLGEANDSYRTQAQELLLSGVLMAYQRWSGNSALRVKIEGHGREDMFKHLDCSETVGWFTSLYPLLLSTSGQSDVGDVIKSVKEQYRRVPNKGFGYGVLTELLHDEQLRELEALHADNMLVFNYLGQFDSSFDESAAFALAKEKTGLPVADSYLRNSPLTVNAIVINDGLNVSISCSKNKISAEKILTLNEALRGELLKIIQSNIEEQEERSLMNNLMQATDEEYVFDYEF